MKTTISLCLTCCLAAPAFGAVQGEPKKPYEDLPGDKPCRHVQSIDESPAAYDIPFPGTVDGVMTRMPIGYSAFVQGWQPNRSVLIENVGETDVCNPQILVNGKRNWHTLDDVVAEATRGYTTPADRARAIWEYQRRQRFHACTWDGECNDVVKVLNVYGYTLCGNEAHLINDLWKAAGLVTRRGRPIGHVVCEVRYDGDYHLLDSDEHVVCLKRDNRTIASCTEIVRDHDLVKRTHTYGIGRAESRKTDEFSASLYVYEGERSGDFGMNTRHSMDLTLRPGESIEFRWDHLGKEYSAGQVRAPDQARRDGLGSLAEWGPTAYDNLRNGKLRYQPNLSSPSAERGAAEVENAKFDASAAAVKPVDPGKPATVTWQFASPYVFVGGKASATVRLGQGASAEWRYSTDGREWQSVASGHEKGDAARFPEGPEGGSAEKSRVPFFVAPLVASLDEIVSPRRKPTYEFRLQLVLRGDAVASEVAFDHDVQTSLLSLPELEVGTNRIVYTDDTETGKGDAALLPERPEGCSAQKSYVPFSTGRQVRITHRWLERATWRAPEAPADAVAPKDGETVAGSRVRFEWAPASDPDGDRVVDYHFELSEHADMRWPLSPNFERLTSRTPSGGEPQWTVPYVGLLNPDTDYYWRVRAKDATGVWGPWSRTFRFRVKVPGVPLDVKLVPDAEKGTGPICRNGPKGASHKLDLSPFPLPGFVLTWRPNPEGEPPVAYQVYGSDEKGFTASDVEYLVNRGKGFVRTMEEFEAKPADAPDVGMVKTPANLIAQVTEASLRVVGPELKLPNTNRAFYRVVAIDASGEQSGPSDYVEVPRPFVVTEPERTAKVGQPYRHELRVIRSLGDLRCRRSDKSSYNAAFWDREEPTFAPVSLPEGLTLDATTGVIAGTPKQPGAFDVVVDVADQFGKNGRASYQLVVEE